MIGRIGIGLGAVALLSACGDDLESRQAAVQERQPMGGEITIGEASSPSSRSASAPAPTPTAQGFVDDEAEEASAGEGDGADITFDATPESLIDNAQGFSPDPIDDTSGFDPTPSAPQGFAPEPVGPETFEE